MLAQWLTRLEPVHEAKSQAEREAVYSLRYRAFVGELQRQFSDVDHERKWLYDGDDGKPHSTILYTGTPQDMTGTLRLRTWAPGQVPAREARWWSMDRFPGIEKLTTAEIGRLTVKPDARGKLILPALVRASYEHLAGQRNADLLFCLCSPGHVRHYQKFGMAPFGGSLVNSGSGLIQIPLVTVLSDGPGFKRKGSFLAPLVKKYFGPGKRRPLDTTPFRHLLQPDELPVESDPAKVWETVQESLHEEQSEEQSGQTFIEACSATIKKLTKSGFVLNLQEGQLLFREGIRDQEVYIVLEGEFEVFRDTRAITLLTRGDLIGEIAFFSGSGQRSASVRALTKGRLLVLRRKFLQELTHSDPEAGFQILMNMSRVMAHRLEHLLKATE